MKEARRRLRRFALWLVALALGFGIGSLAATIAAAVVGAGSDELAPIFWGVVAWAAAGLVATWWFARPRPAARRWLTIGIPVLALVSLLVVHAGVAVAILAYPLVWFAAFCAALYEPAEPDRGGSARTA